MRLHLVPDTQGRDIIPQRLECAVRVPSQRLYGDFQPVLKPDRIHDMPPVQLKCGRL